MSVFYINLAGRNCIERKDLITPFQIPDGFTGPYTREEFNSWRNSPPSHVEPAEQEPEQEDVITPIISKTISGDYSVRRRDKILLANTVKDFNVYLMSAELNQNYSFTIKNINSGISYIIPSGSDTIDFESGRFELYQGESLNLIVANSNWNII